MVILYLLKLWRIILSKSIVVFEFFSSYLGTDIYSSNPLKLLSYLLNLEHLLIFGPVIYRKY